jgi:hypothetical protein
MTEDSSPNDGNMYLKCSPEDISMFQNQLKKDYMKFFEFAQVEIKNKLCHYRLFLSIVTSVLLVTLVSISVALYTTEVWVGDVCLNCWGK